MTIYDVARAAGVSPATVSRVFNGASVSDGKAEAVRKAAAELGFVPNANARRLRTGSSHLVAILVPDIENPFFTALTRGVSDVVREAGYTVLLANTDEEADVETELLRGAAADRLAGLVVVPSGPGTRLELALDLSVPVVCVDREVLGHSVDTVVVDNVGLACEAVATLFGLGYRRPACISGPAAVMTADHRVDGWREAWRNVGRTAPEILLRRGAYTMTGGAQGLESLLALPEPPDSVLGGNNAISLGVLQVLQARGIDPATFGVASLGSLPFTLYTPAGVVVRPLPARQLGVRAAGLLVDRMHGYVGPARRVVVDAEPGDAGVVDRASGP